MRPAYSEQYFGLSDAVNEAKAAPEDFFRSYVNVDHITRNVIDGEKTFVFGPKGTGKSALGLWISSSSPDEGLVSQVRAGVTADLWSVRGAITSGGIACVAGVAVTAAILRDFWSYDARTDEHAVAERAVRAAAGET